MMYTRKQLAQHYGISQSKLRRILKALQLVPDKMEINSKGLPIFYYQEFIIGQINRYLDMLQEKVQKKQKKCSICKNRVPVSDMVGTRCVDCFVKKACMPIIYGTQPWQKQVQPSFIQKAMSYLKGFRSNPK